MKQIIFICSILFVLASCNSDDSDESNVDFSVIAQGDNYKTEQNNPKASLVIKDEAAWNDLVSKINQPLDANSNYPHLSVDLTKYQVIAVIDEIHNYGGYSIDITKITETDNRIIVKVEKLKPGGINTAITQPYHIVKILKTNKEVSFQ